MGNIADWILRPLLIACGIAGVLGAASAARADEETVLRVILPMTGSASFTGKGGKAGLEALQDYIDRTGGINGSKLRFVVRDDQSSPQTAVQLMNEIMETHPPVVLGSAITAMCSAEAPLAAANGPVLYCFSPGIHPTAGTYVYSASVSTLDLSRALIRYFRLRGWTRVAVMTSTDASGQDAERGIEANMALPENSGVTVVAREHFNPGDVSVGAQIENIHSAKPQAFIAWTTGTAVATIFKALVQAGLDIPVGTTNGNMSYDQMMQYAGFVPKQLFIPTGPYVEHDGVFALDPRVEKAQHAMYDSLKRHDVPVDNHAATVWDAAMIVVDGLRKLGPTATAAQLRGYIDGLTDYPGIWGIYNFAAVPQRGLDAGNAVVIRWDGPGKRFTWMSEPGGVPLAPK
jgi:branched-chain amino acid transport system substrate-binding protein